VPDDFDSVLDELAPKKGGTDFDTVLDELAPKSDEQSFRKWYGERASRLGLDPNPDDPRHHYDYRAAYKAGAEPDEAGHWPSRFKAPDHPNRYVGGVDTITGEPHLGPDATSAAPAAPAQPQPHPRSAAFPPELIDYPTEEETKHMMFPPEGTSQEQAYKEVQAMQRLRALNELISASEEAKAGFGGASIPESAYAELYPATNEAAKRLREYTKQARDVGRQALAGFSAPEKIALAAREKIASGVHGLRKAFLTGPLTDEQVQAIYGVDVRKPMERELPPGFREQLLKEAQENPVIRLGSEAVTLSVAMPFIGGAVRASQAIGFGRLSGAIGLGAYSGATAEENRLEAFGGGALFGGLIGVLNPASQTALMRYLPNASPRVQAMLGEGLAFAAAGSAMRIAQGQKLDLADMGFEFVFGAAMGGAKGKETLAKEAGHVEKGERRVQGVPEGRREGAVEAPEVEGGGAAPVEGRGGEQGKAAGEVADSYSPTLRSLPPVKEGYIRVYHGTKPENIETIQKTGVRTGEGEGTVEGAPFVFSYTKPHESFGGSLVVADIPIGDVEVSGPQARISRSIRPDEIIAITEPGEYKAARIQAESVSRGEISPEDAKAFAENFVAGIRGRRTAGQAGVGQALEEVGPPTNVAERRGEDLGPPPGVEERRESKIPEHEKQRIIGTAESRLEVLRWSRGEERVEITQDPDGTWSFSVTKTNGKPGPARYGPREGGGFATEAEARAAGDAAYTKRMGLRAENAEALGEAPPEAPTPPPEASPPEAPKTYTRQGRRRMSAPDEGADTLSTYIRKAGGIRPDKGNINSGELEPLKGRNILRKNGRTADELFTEAKRAGYFPEDATLADFYEALGADVTGFERRYSSKKVYEESELQSSDDYFREQAIQMGFDPDTGLPLPGRTGGVKDLTDADLGSTVTRLRGGPRPQPSKERGAVEIGSLARLPTDIAGAPFTLVGKATDLAEGRPWTEGDGTRQGRGWRDAPDREDRGRRGARVHAPAREGRGAACVARPPAHHVP